jgi:hypothetical protein
MARQARLKQANRQTGQPANRLNGLNPPKAE